MFMVHPSNPATGAALLLMLAILLGFGLVPAKAPDQPKSRVIWPPLSMDYKRASRSTSFGCLYPVHEDDGWMMAVPPSRCPQKKLTELLTLPGKAPSWKLPDPRKKVHSSAVFVGRPLLLVFFRGLRFRHCRKQLVALAGRREVLSAINVAVVAICPDSTEEMSRALHHGGVADSLPFLLLSDESLGTFRAFGCHDGRALHGTYLIGADGVVRWRHVGDEPYMDVDKLLQRCRQLALPGLMAIAAAGGKGGKRNASVEVINIKGTGGQSQYIKEGDTDQNPVSVTVGQTVRWVNKSDAPHSATHGRPGDTTHLFDTDIIDPKSSAEVQFTEKIFKGAGGKPGGEVMLLYYCRKHPTTMRNAKIILKAPSKGRRNARGRRKPFIEPSEMSHKTKRRAAQARPDLNGRWDTLPFHMPINPVHVAMMHTGKVLIISGSGNDPDNKNFQAAVWNPRTLTVKTFKSSWDMFCNGMAILPDGRPFVIGGTLKYDNQTDTKYYPFLGEPKTATFDPATETFANAPDMGAGQGRWYPSATVLSSGAVLVTSGQNNTDGKLNTSVQIWTGKTWKAAGTAFPSIETYPRQHLLPNGKVFVSGWNQDAQMYDPATKTFAFVANTIFNNRRVYGTSVLLPLTPENGFKPKVMIMGGHSKVATDTTELIDLSVPSPKWVAGPVMVWPRIHMNATILPNGKVLTSGGSVIDEDNATAVKEAQLYDPASNAFNSASSMEFPRLYHSNTMLLPDATVVSLGGNPLRKLYQSEIEIYSPPYLFERDGSPAKRPRITRVAPPRKLRYGRHFIVTTPQAKNIKSVVLIRPGAVTHAIDMEQRLVGLTFTAAGGVLRVKAPASGSLAPPGYYLLFILNKEGVPSVARFVYLSKRPVSK
jgi:peroxiredoxin